MSRAFSQRRLFSTCLRVAQEPKSYYVTTPIYYVNAAPHIGHLYSMVLADVSRRWNRLSTGRPGYMTTGTDEHGLKVLQAARNVGSSPKQLVDSTASKFRKLANAANIDYNRFIRTTDKDHIAASVALWNTLQDKGYIYKGSHSGWYCVSDETFYPESQVEKAAPDSEVMISKQTGKTVEWTTEENYFFALSKFQKRLLEFYKQNTDFIYPPARQTYVELEVASGLDDLSISRPSSRCSWGISVPGDESQVMYVWLDALTNYLTSAGFPWSSASPPNTIWPVDAHIIGKDISRFHAVYWPAFLMASGISLPKHIVVHSHWTMQGFKMSKSSGNVADPMEIMAQYGPDTLRYFLLADGHLGHDSPFSIQRLIARHNSDLVNKYGNLGVRICGAKFSIERACQKQSDYSSIPEAEPFHGPLVDELNSLVKNVETSMQKYEPSKAIACVNNVIRKANLYLQDTAPWKMESKTNQDAIIYDAAETARITSLVLQAFIPSVSSLMLDRLGVNRDRRGIEYAAYGADPLYGVGANRKGDYPIKPIL